MKKQQTLDEKIMRVIGLQKPTDDADDCECYLCTLAPKLKHLILTEVLKAMPEKSSHLFKKDSRKCSCIYAKNGKRIGMCLRCVNNDFAASAKGRDKALDEWAKNIREVLVGGEK